MQTSTDSSQADQQATASALSPTDTADTGDAGDAQPRSRFKRLSLYTQSLLAVTAAVLTPNKALAQDSVLDPAVPAADPGDGTLPPSAAAALEGRNQTGTTLTITMPPATPARDFRAASTRDYSQPVMARYQLDIAAPTWARDPRFAELIFDANTGEVVYQRNGMDGRHIASMTKVMTAYLVFQAIEQGRLTPDTTLTVSREAASVLRRTMRMGLTAGQQITVAEALHGLISMSAGDAAIVLAEAVAGSEAEFARQMTDTARRLGAVHSSFGTASGITGDESSAYDVAVIFSQVSRDFPDLYADYFSPPTVTLRNQEQPNCRLCDDGIGATGQKTGTRGVSGSSIVVQIEHANQRFVIVVMGTPSSDARIERAVTLARAVWDSAPVRQQIYEASITPPTGTDSIRIQARVPQANPPVG